MKKMDRTLLPAPGPWRSQDDGICFAWVVMAIVFFTIGALLSMLPDPEPGLPFGILIAITTFAGGVFLLAKAYLKATDGIEDWIIQLPVNTDLFRAMEKAFEAGFVSKGYRFSTGHAESAYEDKNSGDPLGRAFWFHEAPGLTLSFFFGLAGKTSTPFFKIKLGYITTENYQFALRVQRDAVDVLDRLDYKSYQDGRN
jgi:hypothetical protein